MLYVGPAVSSGERCRSQHLVVMTSAWRSSESLLTISVVVCFHLILVVQGADASSPSDFSATLVVERTVASLSTPQSGPPLTSTRVDRAALQPLPSRASSFPAVGAAAAAAVSPRPPSRFVDASSPWNLLKFAPFTARHSYASHFLPLSPPPASSSIVASSPRRLSIAERKQLEAYKRQRFLHPHDPVELPGSIKELMAMSNSAAKRSSEERDMTNLAS